MTRRTWIGIVAALLFASNAGLAHAADALNQPGPYLGLGVVWGMEQCSARLGHVGESAGLNLRAGYRLTALLAVEGLYEYRALQVWPLLCDLPVDMGPVSLCRGDLHCGSASLASMSLW